MGEPNGKVMSVKEAITKFVHDGDELVIGNYTVGSCAELVYEIARQRKKGFTLYSQSGIFDVEVLAAGRELAVELRNARIKQKADERSAKPMSAGREGI